MIKTDTLTMKENITLKDIAEIAGVSITTVSRALRDKEDIGEKTKRKIKEIARRLNYRPDEIARSLILKRTFSLGLVISHLSNPLYGRVVEELEKESKKEGYSLILTSSSGSEETEKNIKLLRGKRVDGIIAGPIFYKGDLEILFELKREKFPVVIFGNIEMIEMDSVSINREKGVYKAVSYLIKSGCRKICYLCTPKRDVTFPTKFKGFERAIYENGLKLREEWIIEGKGTLEDGYFNMKKILKKKEIPDGVFCHNDLVAIGAMKAIKEKGLKIPEDIGVIGFDNIPEGKFYDPSLTTVDQPIEKISVTLIKLLLKRIENPEKKVETVIFEPELIERETTKNIKEVKK